jgi:hypothetical protein
MLMAFLLVRATSGWAAGDGGDLLSNIALNCAAYQSDSADDDHTADLATDGSTETYWQSRSGQSAWLAVDFGELCPFTRITLKWGQCHATALRLEVSNDGLHPQTWKEIFATTNAGGGVQEISVPPTTARHLRVVTTANSDPNQGCILSEVEVYGHRQPLFTPAPQPAPAADGSLELTGGNWKLCNTMFVPAAPEQVAQAGYDDNRWLPAEVPGTVLGSYLAIGAIPDPWYGDQMSQISEDFFSRHDFWYRDTFLAPANDAGKHVWLDFGGINWKAEVYLNGTRLGRIDGAFIRSRFEVTSVLRPGATNYLAVLVHHPAHPGPGPRKIMHQKLGDPTSNGDVLGYDSPTFLASAGWNWLPVVRGLELGIWNHVRLETTGDVELIDPWVITDLPLPDTSRADLTVKTELCNHGTQPEHGELIGRIGDITFSQEETLAPGETKAVSLDKSNCPELSLAHPRLWWPNGYGAQPLYTLNLHFEQDGRISDTKNVTFGIRTISYVVAHPANTPNPVLTLYVNGTRILVRGGNWGMDEGMLNCDAAGYDLRARLHHDANINMIRNWIGMVGKDEFYDACDRHGILIWDDFWMAHDTDGPDPADQKMFMANARDKIRRVRSHPSLALYCGRNESLPPKELDAAMAAAVDELDGTRHYIPRSDAGTVTGRGPYDDQKPEWYFANRGKTLHSELGIVAVPTVESMRAMMPAEDLWPINDMWAIHNYQTGRSDNYTKRIIQRYGAPTGLEDYCRKGQMVSLETSKAIYECAQANQGSGVLIWMTQAAWPSLICQLYDYYFDPTAAYFGAKSGAEPVHILWDSNTDIIKAANNTVSNLTDLSAEAWAYSLAGKKIWHQSTRLNLAATSVNDCFPIKRPPGVFFIKLKLRQGNRVLSDNFYWSSSKGGSCTNLNDLPRVTLPVTVARSSDGPTTRLAVQVKNPTQNVALMIHLKVVRSHSGERVLPVFYEDNYFSLLPGESRTVTIEFAAANLAGEEPELAMDGWNIVPQEVPIR